MLVLFFATYEHNFNSIVNSSEMEAIFPDFINEMQIFRNLPEGYHLHPPFSSQSPLNSLIRITWDGGVKRVALNLLEKCYNYPLTTDPYETFVMLIHLITFVRSPDSVIAASPQMCKPGEAFLRRTFFDRTGDGSIRAVALLGLRLTNAKIDEELKKEVKMCISSGHVILQHQAVKFLCKYKLCILMIK